jgi:hypothetical protein
MDDISKYERQKSLIIIDSLKEYFGNKHHMYFKENLANDAKKMGKTGLAVLADLGTYTHKSM